VHVLSCPSQLAYHLPILIDSSPLFARRRAGGRSVVTGVHILRRLNATSLWTIVVTAGGLVSVVHRIRLRRSSISWRGRVIPLRVVISLRVVVILAGVRCHPASAIHRVSSSASTTARIDAGPKEKDQEEKYNDHSCEDPATIPIPTATSYASVVVAVVIARRTGIAFI